MASRLICSSACIVVYKCHITLPMLFGSRRGERRGRRRRDRRNRYAGRPSSRGRWVGEWGARLSAARRSVMAEEQRSISVRLGSHWGTQSTVTGAPGARRARSAEVAETGPVADKSRRSIWIRRRKATDRIQGGRSGHVEQAGQRAPLG
jgi:hypothetical protein